MIKSADRWLQCSTPNPAARRRLVCFPHAGGSAAFYRGWGSELTALEVLSVRYPGRGERTGEPLPTDMCSLAAGIATALEPLADIPLVLFGHSMGAVVALETARALEARGVRVARLFASGSRNAPLPQQVSGNHTEDDPGLAAKLAGLGGNDPELVADPLFRELVLPYILSDSRMFHAYDNRAEPRLRCPVTTIVGDADDVADLRPWASLTVGGFEEHVVPGDHFYLSHTPPFGLVQRSLTTMTV